MDEQNNQKTFAFCKYCGHKHPIGAKFCPKCGKKIEAAAPLSKEEQDKRLYQQGISLLGAQKFDEALNIFNKLEDFADAKEKAKICINAKENTQKQRLYSEAMKVLSAQKVSEAEINSAIETLKKIEDYRDSKEIIAKLEQLLEKCLSAQKAAQEAALKRQYFAATNHFKSGNFDEAFKLFTALGDYTDSKAQAQKCVEAKENARKQAVYNHAVNVLNIAYVTDVALLSSIEALKSIPDFKDSKDKLAQVEARLKKWYKDKELAEEAERVRIAKAKAKRKKILIFSCVAFLVLALILAAVLFITHQYTITYELDGGTVAVENPSSYTLLSETFTLNNPSRTGYTFVGWSSEDLDTPTDLITVSKGSLGDKTYVANWTANKYQVNFDANGGSVDIAMQEVTFDSSVTYPVPTRTGYTFGGWYTEDLVLYTDGIWKDATNVNLKAKWIANNYTITYEDTDSFTGPNYFYAPGQSVTQTVTFDKNVTLIIPSRTGYGFLGWYNGDVLMESGVWTIPSDVTLSAQWLANSNTLILDANGGTVTSGVVQVPQKTMVVTYDQEFTLPTPTRTGYTFEGWFYGNTQYFSGTWKGLNDLTLVARWRANTYNVTYSDVEELRSGVVIILDYNYSGSLADVISLSNGETFEYPTIPTRSGYMFAGWYTDSDCTSLYSFSGTITDDMTLYAKWVYPSSYTSILTMGGNTGSTYFSSSVKYYPFVSLVDQTITIYTSHSSGDPYIYLYNASKSQLTYNDDGNGNLDSKITYTVTAGTLYYAGFSGLSSGYGYMYLTGTSTPTSTAVVECGTVDEYIHQEGVNSEVTIQFDSNIILPTPERTGYTFLGWYNGNTKIESGAWKIASDVVLTPRWEANQSTITLNANGGTVPSSSISVTYDQAFTLPTPERTGYTFDGWFNGATQYFSGTWNELANITLEAKWTVKTYTITYTDISQSISDVNITLDYNYSGSTPDVITLTNGETFEYPTIPTRSGYMFAGWYTDSDCTSLYSFSGTITDDMRLYAKWVYPSSYTSILTMGGNTGETYFSSSVKYYPFVSLVDQTITIYTSHSSGDPYIYLYNASKSQITYNDDGNGNLDSKITYTVTAGTLYYAGFSALSSGYGYMYLTGTSTPTSTAVVECGTVDGYTYEEGSDISITLEYGEAFTLPSPVRLGYGFLGWYNGATPVTDGTWSIDSDVTLTASWEERPYRITLDANGGSVAEETISVVYGESYTLPAPERTGYTFNGWFCGDDQYEDGVWDELSDITLEARWTANTYTITYSDMAEARTSITVTFDYNYSGSTPDSVILRNGETLEYPTIPTRSGYMFAGWYTDADCTSIYSFYGAITEDLTLYAKWVSTARTALSPYSSNNVYLSSSTTYYSFVALESGYVTISIGKSGFLSCSTTSDYGYGSLTFYCTKGNTYTFYTQSYNGYTSSSYTGYTTLSISSTIPTSTAVIDCSDEEGFVYEEGSSYTVEIEFGSEFVLPVLERDGYIHAGWYDGGTKIESGVWSYDYDLTLTPDWKDEVYYQLTFQDMAVVFDTTLDVTFDYNYAGSTPYTLTTNKMLVMDSPEIPERDGYEFTGWYYDAECTRPFVLYDGIGVIYESMTLYAGWCESKASTEELSSWVISGDSLYSDNIGHGQQAVYTIKAETYLYVTFDFKTSSENYDYFLIKINDTTYLSTSGIMEDFESYALYLAPGETLSLIYSKDGSTSSGDDCVYIENFTLDFIFPSDFTMYVADFDAELRFEYIPGETYSGSICYGEEMTYPELTREGYTFLGWYNGDTKMEDGIWTIEADTVLVPRWQENN